jgi:ADP-ribosyl-[dinitrogen reductase] hydrolase
MVSRRASYEEAVRAAIGLGDDTDTTACVTGGIVGIRFGYAGIPARWRESLRGAPLVAPVLERLLVWRCAP